MNRIRQQRQWTPEELSIVRKRIRAGVPHREIGAELGRSEKAVSSIVYKFNLKTTRSFYRGTDRVTIRHLAAKGYSDRVIGLTIGRTRTAVSQFRNRYGIPAGKSKHDPRKKAA